MRPGILLCYVYTRMGDTRATYIKFECVERICLHCFMIVISHHVISKRKGIRIHIGHVLYTRCNTFP